MKMLIRNNWPHPSIHRLCSSFSPQNRFVCGHVEWKQNALYSRGSEREPKLNACFGLVPHWIGCHRRQWEWSVQSWPRHCCDSVNTTIVACALGSFCFSQIAAHLFVCFTHFIHESSVHHILFEFRLRSLSPHTSTFQLVALQCCSVGRGIVSPLPNFIHPLDDDDVLGGAKAGAAAAMVPTHSPPPSWEPSVSLRRSANGQSVVPNGKRTAKGNVTKWQFEEPWKWSFWALGHRCLVIGRLAGWSVIGDVRHVTHSASPSITAVPCQAGSAVQCRISL